MPARAANHSLTSALCLVTSLVLWGGRIPLACGQAHLPSSILLWFADAGYDASSYAALQQAVFTASLGRVTLSPAAPLTDASTSEVVSALAGAAQTPATYVFLGAHGSSCARLFATLSSLSTNLAGVVFAGCAPPAIDVKDSTNTTAFLVMLGELDGVNLLGKALPLRAGIQKVPRNKDPNTVLSVLTGVTNAQFADGQVANPRDVLPAYAIPIEDAHTAMADTIATFCSPMKPRPTKGMNGVLARYAKYTDDLLSNAWSAQDQDLTTTCKAIMDYYLIPLPNVTNALTTKQVTIANTSAFIKSYGSISQGTLTIPANLAQVSGRLIESELACKGHSQAYVAQKGYQTNDTTSIFPVWPGIEYDAAIAAAQHVLAVATNLLLPHQLSRIQATMRLEPYLSANGFSSGADWVASRCTGLFPDPDGLLEQPVVHTSQYLTSEWPPSQAGLDAFASFLRLPSCDAACVDHFFGAYNVKTVGVTGMLELLTVGTFRF